MIVLKTLYECDPRKNKKCKKTNCFENGGPCYSTFDEDCSNGYIVQESVRVFQEEGKKRKRGAYCGVLAEKDYGTCAHCGAPLP